MLEEGGRKEGRGRREEGERKEGRGRREGGRRKEGGGREGEWGKLIDSPMSKSTEGEGPVGEMSKKFTVSQSVAKVTY